MTQVGTLPLWAMILIGSVVFSFVIGFINPYVTKATLIRLENVDKEDWSKPRPTVAIKERLSPIIVVDFIFVILFVAFMCFLIQGLVPMSNRFGGGVLVTLMVVLFSIIALGLIFIIDMMAYITGLELTATRLRRHFERQYGARVERES